MNRKKKTFLVLCLVLAVLLGIPIFGWAMVLHVFGKCEQIIMEHESHEALLAALKPEAVLLLVCSGLIVMGVLICIILIFWISGRGQREITALKQKNEAMEQINRQIQQMAHHQRLEMIGTLTSSISHEFNNLLTPIMGYSLMALERIDEKDTELYDGLVEIYESSRKAKTIISRLSDLSRKNSSAYFREVSLDELTRKTLDVAAPAKPGQVEIKLNLNCWDQRISANELQLSQLLLNLILNGFHAMQDSGGLMTVDTWFDEDSVFLSVSDTGCGIPENILLHIFDPFFTTKEEGKGTGLGLAIAAQVVEEHCGSIHVDSQVGKGSEFTVSLPRRTEAECGSIGNLNKY